MNSALAEKLGLKQRTLGNEAISPGHIVSLDVTDAKLLCLCYLSIAPSSAHVRYLIRRLRTIIPTGCTILVGYFSSNGNGVLKALQETAEADAYATSLLEALKIIVGAAHPQATPSTEFTSSSRTEKAAKSARRKPPLRVVTEKAD